MRGNDYSPVAVCAILAAFDSAMPRELNEMVVAGVDAGAAISGCPVLDQPEFAVGRVALAKLLEEQ